MQERNDTNTPNPFDREINILIGKKLGQQRMQRFSNIPHNLTG